MLETRLQFPLAATTSQPASILHPGLIHCYRFGWVLPYHLCFTFVYMFLFPFSPEGQAEAGAPDKEASNQPESSDGTTSS